MPRKTKEELQKDIDAYWRTVKTKPSRGFNDFIIGKKFNRLNVISFSHTHKWDRFYKCECECGKIVTVMGHRIKSGKTKSCSCFQADKVSQILTVHGMHKSKEYKSWSSMKCRCTNSKIKCYENYGGRGITVCRRWMDSFENFLSDMGLMPNAGMEIERKDNNLGYFKENCKWATRREQVCNRRNTIFLKFKGVTKPLSIFASESGIPYWKALYRYKLGYKPMNILKS